MNRSTVWIAAAAAAAAFLGWVALSVHRELPAAQAPVGAQATAGSGVAPAGPDTAAAPAALAGPPAAPQPQVSPAADAAGTAARADVVAASDRRQLAKITRGMSTNPGGGIRVEEAPPGSVAGQMHLQPGDVLVSVNNEAVSSPEDFARIYRAQGKPGEFVVIRGGREMHRR